MSSGFQRHRRSGRVIATFSGLEADLLRSLAAQLVELLRNESATVDDRDPLEALLDFSGPSTPPDDPVLARLFPTAYPDDDEAAAEFRRFTEGSLRDGKARSAGQVIDTLEDAGLPPLLEEDGLVIDVELEPDEAMTWLRFLADVRLARGTRLEVSDDDEDFWWSLPDDDPRAQTYDLYAWLTALQSTMVDAVSHGLK